MKNKNNNQNEFERLGGQKSGGGGIYPPYPPPPIWIRHWTRLLINYQSVASGVTIDTSSD